jgi:predicted RNA-binding Zn-ribbon protein involved in translation (DUF1610 family)
MRQMKLIEMKAKCRICGKELIADTKDSEFVSFYCMKCGVYTMKPVEDYKDKPAPAPEAVAIALPKPEDKQA